MSIQNERREVPAHPSGEIIREDFITDYGLTVGHLG